MVYLSNKIIELTFETEIELTSYSFRPIYGACYGVVKSTQLNKLILINNNNKYVLDHSKLVTFNKFILT